MSDALPPHATPKKPEKGFAWGAAVWTAIAGGLAFRALYHPHRAAVERGFAQKCAGDGGCGSPMTIQPEGGTTNAFALSSGTAAVTKAGLVLVSDREPVLIGYGQNIGQLLITSGDSVGIGTPLAVMRSVELSITEIVRAANGSVSFRQIEPASWLASRGLSIAAKGNAKGSLWCTQGRKIVLPQRVAACGTRLPGTSAMLLLPVSVTME